MSARQMIGYGLLVSPFLAIAAVSFVLSGLLATLFVFGVSFGIVGVIVLGVHLVTEPRP